MIYIPLIGVLVICLALIPWFVRTGKSNANFRRKFWSNLGNHSNEKIFDHVPDEMPEIRTDKSSSLDPP